MQKVVTLLGAAMMTLSTQTLASDAISEAAASGNRSAEAKLRDEYRHPQQTLRFFGIEPDMTVVEIWPGGGWYTDILAELLREEGQLIAAHFFIDESASNYRRNAYQKFEQKLSEYAPYKNIKLTAFDPVKALEIAPAGSADAVLTFRNVHNWYMNAETKALDNAFRAFYNALKPGGVLGVVDHEMPETLSDEAMKSSGYMKKSLIVAAAEQAGFKLVAESQVNANPLDNAQHPKGVWTLPPSLDLGEQDRDQYLAIGESNRMTLKFVKPE
ncbi:methyltransferase [Alteromonas aestuariivivens]|uniref:Methyltransferase n=1 Tax=Alteromonas aestuariivivens TaxID=1938339 RepID=A0A3D8M5W7_9ALTE|nr:class I SAM-dependent methyltransferase [Alteromonas aestuariivivens]RDV24924.1 methyltransferase [Alteromonas aestuariivivens]